MLPSSRPGAKAAAARSGAVHSVRFDDAVHFAPSPAAAGAASAASCDASDIDSVCQLQLLTDQPAAPTPPPRPRVISKWELLQRIECASGGSVEPAAAAAAEAATVTSNVSNRVSESLDEQLILLPKYQPLNAVPPPVDTRGCRGGRVSDSVKDAAASASAGSDRPAARGGGGRGGGGVGGMSRRRLAVNERIRSKQSSVCAMLFVFFLLIIPVAIVAGTATQISSGCKIWLDSPVLLMVIGLCSAVLAVTVPLFLFRLMGVRCLEDMLSICTIALLSIVMAVIIFVLLMVITGAMIFEANRPEGRKVCGEFIKKFVVICVAILWFLVGASLLAFCCDSIMS